MNKIVTISFTMFLLPMTAHAQGFLDKLDNIVDRVDSTMDSLDRTTNKLDNTSNRMNDKLLDVGSNDNSRSRAGSNDLQISREEQDILNRAEAIQASREEQDILQRAEAIKRKQARASQSGGFEDSASSYNRRSR